MLSWKWYLLPLIFEVALDILSVFCIFKVSVFTIVKCVRECWVSGASASIRFELVVEKVKWRCWRVWGWIKTGQCLVCPHLYTLCFGLSWLGRCPMPAQVAWVGVWPFWNLLGLEASSGSLSLHVQVRRSVPCLLDWLELVCGLSRLCPW